MKTNVVIDISPRMPHTPKFGFSSYGPKAVGQSKLQDSLKCNISRKNWIDELYFWHEDIHLSFLQFPGVPKVLKIRTLLIFAISPLKPGGWVDFLSVDKHESFPQVDSITLSEVPKVTSLQYLCIISRKHEG